MYTPQDIVWVKNVLRQKGKLWAYDQEQCGTQFLLHWSSQKKGSAKTPKVGDVILLFQTPTTVKRRPNKTVFLTHLVTPLSEQVVEDPLSPDHKWAREVSLVAKASPIHAIPNPGFLNFFLPNRGLTNPIHNITNIIGLTTSQTQGLIGNYFSRFICPGVAFKPSVKPDYDLSGQEGARIRRHLEQELIVRDRKLIIQAKQHALAQGNGRIRCECCGFDFVDGYGELGENYIECHHKVHLKVGERITGLNDLAFVCANCHRMLHRMPGTGSHADVARLKQLIKVNFIYRNI